jgi:hypothetical protein
VVRGERFHVSHRERRLLDDRALARRRDHQVRLHVGLPAQDLE